MLRSYHAFALLAAFPLAAAAAAAGWAEPSAEQAAGAPAAASPALTGEAIYLRAVHAMRALPAPDFVIFHEDVATRNLRMQCDDGDMDFSLHHGDMQAQYRVWYRTKDGEGVAVDQASGKRCDGGELLQPVARNTGDDLFGGRAKPTPEPDLSVTSGGPPVIAAVRAESAQHYRITLVDEESFEGHPVYRLALQAYHRDMDYPLTGLLVDANSWLVHQVTGEVSGHLVVASGWIGLTITFAPAGPWWVVRDEHFDMAASALLMHARVRVDVHASDFSFPKELPPSVFPSPQPHGSATPHT